MAHAIFMFTAEHWMRCLYGKGVEGRPVIHPVFYWRVRPYIAGLSVPVRRQRKMKLMKTTKREDAARIDGVVVIAF